ncbi:nitrilase-related carbon-nitrogen hydrolase [Thermodesulfobacteriota bacterium]
MIGYDDKPKFKVAAVQSGAVYREPPQYFDVAATLEKAIGFIEEASRQGAKLVVFSECFLPGYPYFGADNTNKHFFGDIWAKYLWNSVEVPGRETEALCAVAKRTGTYIAMGINERDKQYAGRMYNSILYVSPQGTVLGTHRKICNTFQERLFHVPGDGGDNLKTVFETEIGKLGGSICGEHCQFTLLHNWIMQGVQVHCSLWPGIKPIEAHIDVNTRAMCYAGHCFGVLSSCYLPKEDWPSDFYENSLFKGKVGLHGGSGVVNPNGEYIAGPVYDEETIVYGDVDLGLIDQSLFAVNLTGAYTRWDILNVNVRQEPYEPLAAMDDADSPAPETKSLKERIAQLERQVAALSQEKAKDIKDKK